MTSLGHEELILKRQGNYFVEMSFDPEYVQIEGILFMKLLWDNTWIDFWYQHG